MHRAWEFAARRWNQAQRSGGAEAGGRHQEVVANPPSQVAEVESGLAKAAAHLSMVEDLSNGVCAGLEGSQSVRFAGGPGDLQVAPRHTTAPTA